MLLGEDQVKESGSENKAIAGSWPKVSIENATIPEANLTAQMAGIQCFAEKAPRQCFPPRLKPPSPLSRRVVKAKAIDIFRFPLIYFSCILIFTPLL